jgi:hypothetical protein
MKSHVVRFASVAAGLWMLTGTASAQTTETPFATRLEQARSTLQVSADGSLQGNGAKVIAAAVTKARYVLLGEDHLSREIPQFATGICRIMAPGGLHAFAVETGPEVTKVVNANLRRPDRLARIAAFARAHPDVMAFQNGRDESDMAAACAQAAGPRFQVWGLDQEFFGATGYLLEQMLAAHPGPTARSAIEQLAALDRSATTNAVGSGSVSDLFIYKISDAQMQAARSAIAKDGGTRANELFIALAETREIFLGQQTDGYASNGQRARLMKRTLAHYLATAPAAARVLFKFGDVHMAKGVNNLRQRDVGNFVAERAEGEGASSLHIAVYGAKGQRATYGGVGRPLGRTPFVLTEDADYAWLKDALALHERSAGKRDWMLVDLRQLRTRMPADMPAAWRKLVLQYDMIVVAPELTPSMLLGSR